VSAFIRLGRVILGLAGLDALATGLWLAARPAGLLHFLDSPASPDALLLLHGLGAIHLGYAGCLLLSAARHGAYRGLAVAPLLGLLIQAGLWLWLLGTRRVSLPAGPLGVLLGHDGFWALALALALAAEGRRARG
jgi:hypothetical protein